MLEIFPKLSLLLQPIWSYGAGQLSFKGAYISLQLTWQSPELFLDVLLQINLKEKSAITFFRCSS